MRNILFVIFLVFLQGCFSNYAKIFKEQNEMSQKRQDPYRLIKVNDDGKFEVYKTIPAGEVAISAVFYMYEPLLKKDVFDSFRQKCGFDASDLLETRLVDSDIGYSYEVWVFKDELSKREDKTSALSLILVSNPKIGGTDIGIKGACHASDITFVVDKF